MLRFLGAIVAAYLTMALLVATSFTVVYLMMGTDGAFQPGTYEVSTLWLVASFVLGLLAAVAGGWVCARIARERKAVFVLAGLVLVLGLIMAVPVWMGHDDRPQVRPADVPALQAMQLARQPPCVALLNPLVGAAGVLLGGRSLRR